MYFSKTNNLLIILLLLQFLTEINANDPCDEPCIDHHLKPECRGMYDDNKQYAQHYTNVFFAPNEKEFIRNNLAISIIMWHRTIDNVLTDKSSINWINSARKFMILTHDLWETMQHEFDTLYCQIFDSKVSLEHLELLNSNFVYFFVSINDSIKGLNRKEFVKVCKKKGDSFKDVLQVSSIMG
uniref:Uncharacterized protein n=1 Tax=Meloidogyne hapla TaxID=6305 RepID=A0A1I8B8V5_MELHA